MSSTKTIFFLPVFCIYHFLLQAQNPDAYIFRHIDPADGLLNNNVSYITQDKSGFMWIVTPGGLQRYDGGRFINFPYDPRSADSIDFIAGHPTDFSCDPRTNEIWIADRKIKKISLASNATAVYSVSQLLQDTAFGFRPYHDAANSLWYAGKMGIIRHDMMSGKDIPVFLVTPMLQKSNRILFQRDSGRIWLGAEEGLLLFDQKTRRVWSQKDNPTGNPLLRQLGQLKEAVLYLDHFGHIWITGTPGNAQFYQYLPASGSITRYGPQKIHHGSRYNPILMVYSFFEDNHAVLWVTTSYGGLLRYEREPDQFSVIGVNGAAENQISFTYDIFSIFQDRNENIWLGTDKGISVFNPYRQPFYFVRSTHGPASLPDKEIDACIPAGNGDLLTGTWGGGITVLDRQSQFKKQIHFTGPEEYNQVWSFVRHTNGTIWAGCQHGYIHQYDPSRDAVQSIHPPETQNSTIICMENDPMGNIIIGLYNGGVAVWNHHDQQFHRFADTLQQSALAAVSCIFTDARNRCWVGTACGLKRFDIQTMKFTGLYLPDPQHRDHYSTNWITDITSLDDHTLLLGTLYDGPVLFHTDQAVFSPLPLNGAPRPASIWAIHADLNGQYWLAGDYSIYRYSPKRQAILPCSFEKNMLNTSFRQQHFITLPDGRWVIPTKSELVSFDPRLLNAMLDRDSARAAIAGIKVNDQEFPVDSLLHSHPVFNYRQNAVTIALASPDYSLLQSPGYVYQLSGVDPGWVNAGSRNGVNYSNLKPGNYTFQLRPAHSAGPPTSFSFTISPPFWQTLLFKAAMIALAALSIFGFLRWRIHHVRHQASFQQKMVEAEMMALRLQMNPHFIFNCLNSIDNLIQLNQREKATVYLSKFASLIRSVLESSRNNLVPCWKDVDTLRLYLELEQFRWDHFFSFEIQVPDTVINGDYKVPPLILQPFVENAIQHGLRHKAGGSRNLWVRIRADQQAIYYTVEDNGVGRAVAAKYSQPNLHKQYSLGIPITEDRIKLFNGGKGGMKITDLSDENGAACGTRVDISIFNQDA